jgi:hypothetical protein
METKIFNALKQDHSKLGLSEDVLQAYARSLNATGLITDENLATVSKGQESALKVFQSNLDKERTSKTALQKAYDDYKAAHPEGGGEPDKKDEPDKNLPEWFKAFQTKQTELEQKLSVYEKEKTTQLLSGQLMTKLKEKGISEKFIKGRSLNIEKAEDIDTVLAGIEADWNEFAQEQAESGVVLTLPKQSTDGLKEGEAIGKSIAEKRNTGASDGVKGKEIT